jgi:hypothetical protein
VDDLVTDLNEKVFVPDYLLNLNIEHNTVFNECTNYLENLHMWPWLVANIKTESLQEFHLFDDFDDVDWFYKISIVLSCIFIVGFFDKPVDDIVNELEHFGDHW